LASVISNVSHLRIDSFPNADLWEEFQELISETTKVDAKPGHRGTIHATTSQMDDDEAARWLRKAFDIFSSVAQDYGKTKAIGHNNQQAQR
jgi:hypothetical protein